MSQRIDAKTRAIIIKAYVPANDLDIRDHVEGVLETFSEIGCAEVVDTYFLTEEPSELQAALRSEMKIRIE